MRNIAKFALAALATGAVMSAPAAALASTAPTPVVGTGVGGSYIGDTVTNPRYAGTEADAIPGNTPIAPGTSASFALTVASAGNVPETVAIGQDAPNMEAWLVASGGKGAQQIPGAWISSTFPATAALAPGQAIAGTVTVTVPAGAHAGEYVGLFGTGASAPGSGNVKLVTGASMREYVTVP
jgi:hypothetical protein